MRRTCAQQQSRPPAPQQDCYAGSPPTATGPIAMAWADPLHIGGAVPNFVGWSAAWKSIGNTEHRNLNRVEMFQLRAQAASTLGEMGDTAVIPKLGALLHDQTPLVQVAAAGAILRLDQ